MNTTSNLLAADGLEYEEAIALLNENDFFRLFTKLNAEPRWTNTNGKKSIQVIGRCHHGESHSALFDTTTLIAYCFSECGKGMLLHRWVKQALNMDNQQEAKDFILEWIENEDINLSNRTAQFTLDFNYKEREYKPEHIEPVQTMPQAALDEVYSNCDCTLETLSRLVWSTKDGISADILKAYDVAYHKINETIILPHHNINGKIVGLYERSFKSLRKDVKRYFPDVESDNLLKYPRAKYVPLLKDEKYRTDNKTSWSFANSQNLYGLHLAKEAIKDTGIAIVFEGAKSVMLARQYGYLNAVATHTFGIHINHISMLIECGAKEIVLAFDKQYEDDIGKQWELYEKKTKDFAAKVKDYVAVSRIIDIKEQLEYKDAPIDKGKEVFEYLYSNREYLTSNKDNIEPQAQLEEDKSESIFNIENDNTSTLFRGKPIKWNNKVRYKTFEKDNAFEDETEKYERYNGKNHFIEYDGKQYKQDEFLQTNFERYREIQKRVEFDDDTLKFLACLSTSQCEKLQYHILAQYFDLVEVDIQDSEDLKLFALQYDSNYKRLYIRLNWENGLNKIVAFGAGLQVPKKPPTEKMYCYQQYFKHDKATFIAVNMTWERWSIAIIEEAKKKHIDNAIKAMNYQDEIYMTWTKEERKTIQQWIYNYKSGAIFPFSGEIERGESRTILFNKHCKIVDNIRRRETIAQYNKENRVELAAARGKVRHTKSALSDYKKLKGNEWTTAELLIMLDNNNKKIKRLVDEGLIERIKRGYYRRK